MNDSARVCWECESFNGWCDSKDIEVNEDDTACDEFVLSMYKNKEYRRVL